MGAAPLAHGAVLRYNLYMSGPAYPRVRVEAALVEVALPPGYRIVPGRYLPSPLGTAPANSRFCTETAGFTILYTASDFASAFLETNGAGSVYTQATAENFAQESR